MPPARRRASAPGRRLALGLALTGVALTGCDATTACPAIGYGNVLTVTLADGWPGSRPSRSGSGGRVRRVRRPQRGGAVTVP